MKEEEKRSPEGDHQPEAHEDAQPEANIVPLHDVEVKYDVEEILAFISQVFHTVPEGATPFAQLSKKAPRGYGLTPEQAIPARLAKSNAPMKGYMSTATLEPIDGILRHTKAAFKSFNVLVLDDVGTKIPEDKIPEAMHESYCIESSEDNYQLGYILKDPIMDYEEAQLFIDLFVDAGLTDGGGAMPVKKVRLPCGVNGKEGPKGAFLVRLNDFEGHVWGIQELLDAAGITVDWEQHRKQARDNARRVKRLGAGAWNKELFHIDPQNGLYDPVLEWMHKRGEVLQEAQEPFMDVVCPFHDEHTGDGLEDIQCGYSPLGHGAHPHARIFHCFHEHCKGRQHTEFLERIHNMGGPEVPQKEFAPAAMLGYVYDSIADKVYDVKRKGKIFPQSIKSVCTITPRVMMPSGKWADPLPLWLKQPSAPKVYGATFDPTQRSRLIQNSNGDIQVNQFHMPDYDPCKPNLSHVEMFLDFIRYLFVVPEEQEYFLDWLACKTQNPSFRGAAVVLSTEAQGTGKNTLMKILERLFGGHNCQQVNLDKLINNNFNEWATKLFVNVNESLATGEGHHAMRMYNNLKEIVDPAPMDTMVNIKYGDKFSAVCATSFLFFSNHVDAVYLQDGDRRFWAASGPEVPASGEYFGKFYKWLESGKWEQHVWNWLMQRTVDMVEMMQAPPQGDAMQELVRATTSPIEAVIKGAIAVYPSQLVCRKLILEMLVDYLPRGIPEKHQFLAERLIRAGVRTVDKERNKVCGQRHGRKKTWDWDGDLDGGEFATERVKAMEFLQGENPRGRLHDLVDEWLIDNDYDF